MTGTSLAQLEQNLGIRLLCLSERIAIDRANRRNLRSSQGTGAIGVVLHGQLGDPPAQILLPIDEIARAVRSCKTSASQQLEHLASAQLFRGLEGTVWSVTQSLRQSQLRIDVPFVREKCRPAFGERQRASHALHIIRRGA